MLLALCWILFLVSLAGVVASLVFVAIATRGSQRLAPVKTLDLTPMIRKERS